MRLDPVQQPLYSIPKEYLMKKAAFGLAAAGLLVLILASTGNAQKQKKPPSSPGMPEVIYVTDFLIELGDITEQRHLLRRPIRRQESPEAKAGKLVELLSTSLVTELRNKSVPVVRLYPGQTTPAKGWLVKGQFLEVDEGNRLQRTMVGFGAGATDMQIEVAVVDLASGSHEPFLVFGTDSKSGKGPGAVVMFNPYVAAAKFVLSKRASEKDVRKTARQISDVLVKYMTESNQRPK